MSFGVVGLLGTLPFVCASGLVLTYKDVSREISTRWAHHEVIGRKPVHEWVGDEAQRVSFKVRFDSSLNAPPTMGLFLLRKMLEKHEPQILLLGPEYMGKFILESISEERRFHTGLGICQVAEASITLTECA